ncbi:hypothetical protein Tsp_05409 [Trichinella spiralis]|nr:hypothetical protein Tsp_05409 [Trichinella spiralis]
MLELESRDKFAKQQESLKREKVKVLIGCATSKSTSYSQAERDKQYVRVNATMTQAALQVEKANEWGLLTLKMDIAENAAALLQLTPGEGKYLLNYSSHQPHLEFFRKSCHCPVSRIRQQYNTKPL